MSNIPSHFLRLFQSIQTVDQHFNISIQNHVNTEEEKTMFIKFCKNTLIAEPLVNNELYEQWKDHDQKENRSTNLEDNLKEESDLSMILDDIVSFFNSHWTLQKNALLAGYEKFENSFINQMKGDRNWDILLKIIGKDSFSKVLLEKVILCKLDNGSYYQLAGNHLKGTLYLQHQVNEKERSRVESERLKISAALNRVPTIRSTGNEVDSKSVKLSRRQKRKMEAAIEEDVLHNSDKKRKRGSSHDTNSGCISRADIFYSHVSCDPNTNKPSMGLPGTHVLSRREVDETFISSCIEKIFPIECETSRKKKLLLKRLKQFPDLLLKVANNHRKKGLSFFLDSRCPKRIIGTDIDSAASTHNEVSQFIISTLFKMFPSSFWGSSDHNFKIICTAVKEFVKRHVNENMDLKEILFKYKVKECEWLAPPNKPDKVVITDLRRRQALLSQVMFWLFNDYIKPILRHTFHITEHAKHSKRVFYYRKDVWHEITKSALDSIKNSSYIPFENMYSPSLRKLGMGKLRLVPKKDGFRPITKMRFTNQVVGGKVQVNGSKIDTSEALRPVLEVLNSEKRNNPNLVGSSVFGKQLFYQKLKNYKKRFASGTKFFFVKADVAKCFDSIDQMKLLNILGEILGEDSKGEEWPSFQKSTNGRTYFQRDLDIFEPHSNRIVPKSYTTMSTADSMKFLSDELESISNVPLGSIIVDKDKYNRESAKELYDLLKKSITENAVQIGDGYYRRNKGIAQGSILSTLLCSFFLGDFEERKLAPILKSDTEGALFSYVDDYLYITTNKSCAKWLKNTILYELPKFNQDMRINKDKCCSNLEEDVEDFTWLGYKINCATLDVKLDRNAKDLKEINDSITTQYAENPGLSFHSGCIQDIKSKMHAILMDTDFNSKETVLSNLFDNFLIAAAKLESRTSNIAKSRIGFTNQRYIATVILKVSMSVISNVPKRITIDEMMALYFKAFYQVYLRKQTRYPFVVHFLKYNHEKCQKAAATSTAKSVKRKMPPSAQKGSMKKQKKKK